MYGRDSEIYLAPSNILAIPSDSSASSYSNLSLNDNQVVNSACSKSSSKQFSNRFSVASNLSSDVLIEAVYHKGAWFAVDLKQLEECQSREKSGKLAEVRVVKMELFDLSEELRSCLVENYRQETNDCPDLSDDERFFTRGSKGGYKHLSVRDTFETGINDRIEATIGQKERRPPDEPQGDDDGDNDDCDEDEDDSSSEGDWSGEDCNSSDDHGCRRICDDGRSASSDSDEECLLKD